MENKLSIIVNSCDRYKDCWKPFLFSIDKYWPDCPYDIYILSNFESIQWHNATFIKVGMLYGFGNEMSFALNKINSDYVLYMQEDYFLSQKVNTEAIEAHLQHCITNNVDQLKLSTDGSNRDKYRIEQSDYCINPMDKPYAINTDISIWNRDSFIKVCFPDTTIWDWERSLTTYVNDHFPNFRSEVLFSSLYNKKGIVPIPGTAILKGKWTRSGADFLITNGFNDELKKRGTIGYIRRIAYESKTNNHLYKFIIKAILKFMEITKFNF